MIEKTNAPSLYDLEAPLGQLDGIAGTLNMMGLSSSLNEHEGRAFSWLADRLAEVAADLRNTFNDLQAVASDKREGRREAA